LLRSEEVSSEDRKPSASALDEIEEVKDAGFAESAELLSGLDGDTSVRGTTNKRMRLTDLEVHDWSQ